MFTVRHDPYVQLNFQLNFVFDFLFRATSVAFLTSLLAFFIFTLLLPEGRAGILWKPSNKVMFFLPLTFFISALKHLVVISGL